MLVGGTEAAALDGRWLPVSEPATGSLIAEVPRGTAADIAAATSAALAARRLAPYRRRRARSAASP